MKLTLMCKPAAWAAAQMLACMAMAGCGGGGEAATGLAEERTAVAAETATMTTWTTIAREGQAFTVNGTQVVRYGEGTRWVQKTVTSSGSCTNGFFGTDPAYGVVKSCQLQASEPAPAPSTSTTWSRIAGEGQSFTLSGTQTVRYGADTRWVQKSVANGGQCTNSFFGKDPAYGVVKACEVQASAPTPAPAPAPAPAPSTGTACDTATGRVLLVGPGKTYAVPSAAAAVALSGDVIKIAAGDYYGDVATWRASNLTLCGTGGRARLFANGRNAGGKAIWVIQGGNTTVDGIEFRDAKVPDQNGAGIRAEGMNLTVRNSAFFDNENGILGGSSGTVTIDRSEFGHNGRGDGQSHNIYIGSVEKLHVMSSFFHEAKIGHNFKSRAKQTIVENSYFMDGPEGTASYLIDTPNGGAVFLRGNLFHKGPKADNSIAVAFGQEGLTHPVNTLEMVHNTIVMTRYGGYFIAAPGGTQAIRLKANILAGTGSPKLLLGGFPSSSVVQQDNLSTSAANFTGADNIASPYFWPNAGVQGQIGLGHVPDVAYSRDAPKPFVSRALSSTARVMGALQSAP